MTKTWAEQTAELAEAWSKAQSSLWQGWMKTAAQVGHPQEDMAREWMGHWQEVSKDVTDQFGAHADGVPREVVERLFAAEEIYLRFFDSMIGYMKVVAPRIDAGEDWADLVRAYSQQLKDSLVGGPEAWFTAEGMAAATEGLPELWKLYTLEIQKASMPWAQSMAQAPWDTKDLMSGDHSAVSRMFNMFMDTWEQTYGRYLSAPAIGYSREMNEKVARGFEAWVDLRRAVVEFMSEVMNAGGRSLEDLVRDLVDRGERDESITTFKGLFDLWVNNAEGTFAELFRTEGFARIQGEAVNAAMTYKLRQRDVTEEFMKALDLPTRSEIDEVHRHVHDVRIELRYTKRTLEATRAELQQAREALDQEAKGRAAAQEKASQEKAAQEKAAQKQLQQFEKRLEKAEAATKKAAAAKKAEAAAKKAAAAPKRSAKPAEAKGGSKKKTESKAKTPPDKDQGNPSE